MNATNDTDTISTDVDAILERIGVIYAVRYVGETAKPEPKGKPWACDAWRATFTLGALAETFDYFTGLGLRKKNHQISRPVAPDAAQVLYSLTSDAEAADMSFADWCGSFGYSDDSLSALNTYRECCAIGQRMHKLFGREALAEISEAVREL